jgi:NDP-sugar pyrophosphorylase family protein
MNILIPISTKLDTQEKYFPKNLLEVNGKPLIQEVIDSFSSIKGRFIFVVSREESKKYHTDKIIKMINPQSEIIFTENATKGALATCMLAIDFINTDEDLIIASGDQILNIDLTKVIDYYNQENVDGGILTFKSFHPKWSYIQVGDDNLVKYVQEKKVISNRATVGVYYFKKGYEFIQAAMKSFLENDSVNNVFYVSHVYNHLILKGKKIGYFEIENTDFFKVSNLSEIEVYSNLGK